MIDSIETDELVIPSLLDRRWREIKTAMHKLAQPHLKAKLLQALIRLREKHTSAPTLIEITNFTGFDVAMHTIQRWSWSPFAENNDNFEADAKEIGKYGSELLVLHTIRESIRNNLLFWDRSIERLSETDKGVKHFQTLNSFNVDITGSRMDIARKRFSLGRLSKHQRQLNPVNTLSSVKRLYWENSILMLLRAPLSFYRAMQILTSKQHKLLMGLHSKLVKKSEKQAEGMITIRISTDTKIAEVLDLLTPPSDFEDRRPRFVACYKLDENNDNTKVKYQIGLGALTMFTMFLLGFEREHLDEKATRAERAVCDVIESSGFWNVIESNTEVLHDKGEVITEIDIVARSKRDPDSWITFEVKDFSFWRGWIYGQGSENRKRYYLKAVEKFPIREQFIYEKHFCKNLTSFIVTSIPEAFESLNGIRLIYLADLSEELMRLSNYRFTPRKRHTSSNFLIRYFERVQNDYQNADKLNQPNLELKNQIYKIKDKLKSCKEEYDKIRETYNMLTSEHETLLVSKKLTSKRLVKDSGERHFQIENELNKLENMIVKSNREKQVKAKILRDLKEKYNLLLQEIRNKELESHKIEQSIDRLLASRLF